MTSTYYYPTYQDTIYTPRPQDTVNPVIPPSQPSSDRLTDSNAGSSAIGPNTIIRQEVTVRKPPVQTEVAEQPAPANKEIVVRELWNSSGNFLTENGLTGIVRGLDKEQDGTSARYTGTVQTPGLIPMARKLYTYDWLLGIFLFLVILFVWIRIFYSKFFATLASALVSFQLSVKLFEERNVLLHRVSIVLDFIYIIVFSVFIFELIEYFGFSGTTMSGIKLFLLLMNILTIYALLRIVVLRMTGSLFLARPLFAEYIHNTFVVNKGLGIALFPIVIMAQYLPYRLVPVVLVIGVLISAIAFLLKTFRAYQIIIRRDILLFYLILYLCTLEILPLLLGYKFVTSLIQSN